MSSTEPPRKDTITEIHENIGEFLKACSGPASPLVNLIWPSFHQKKVEQWRNEVHNKLEDLSKRYDPFSIENLQQSPEFTSVLIQSIQIAARNFQDEKLNFLKNAILNTPISELSTDLKLTFLNFLDELSVSHTQLLAILNEKINDIQVLPSLLEVYQYLNDNYNIDWTKHEFKMFILGLQTRGLIRISDDINDFPGEVTTLSSLIIDSEEASTEKFITVLETGQKFLKFILTENIE
jgi:hypothetical protein